MDKIRQYEPLWGSWYVEEKLGSGGFGAVYKVSKQAGRVKEYAAVKLIRNTIDEKQKQEMKKFGMSDAEISRSLDKRIQKAEDEIIHMSSLKGVSEIVSIEDYSIFKLKDGSGYDLLIRMELLTSLDDYLTFYMNGLPLPEEEVCSLGMDICTALDYCEQMGIVHKDIKPSNIFINPKFKKNKYELGDFGLARRTDHSTVMSRSGTTSFISPEVWRMEKAGFGSDIYCLGLTMYSLLNHNRLPFYPPYPEVVDYEDQEEATSRRLAGEEIPPPYGDRGHLWKIIQKACRYNKDDRYQHAAEMKADLIRYLADMGNEDTINQEQEKARQEAERQEKVRQERARQEAEKQEKARQERARQEAERQEKAKRESQKKAGGGKKKGVFPILGIVLFLVVGALMLPSMFSKPVKSLEDSLSVGDRISFGSYEQDNGTRNGTEEIVWKVLAENNGSLLLISEESLDAISYHGTRESISWEKSSLRSWLNETFYNSAFTEEEKTRINVTEVKAEDNPDYGTDGGNDTQDRVFLLSISETETYLKSSKSRKCKPSVYAGVQAGWSKPPGSGYWWLRSPGENNTLVAAVITDGTINSKGFYPDGSTVYVRPAIWVTP